MSTSEDLRRYPLYAVLFLIVFANFFVSWYIQDNRSHFGVLNPDAIHTYAIRYRGGIPYFFSPRLGEYLDLSFLGHFVGIGLLMLLVWWYRRRERHAG